MCKDALDAKAREDLKVANESVVKLQDEMEKLTAEIRSYAIAQSQEQEPVANGSIGSISSKEHFYSLVIFLGGIIGLLNSFK
jgi:hypothetical protein